MRLYLMLTLLGILAVQSARGQDLVKESVPQKWVEEYLPETLGDLKFPAYYNMLDKARALSFHGRYKAALIELRKVKGGDAPAIALVKASALAAVGREEEAIAALARPDVVEKPKAQVLRASILRTIGRTKEAIALLKEHLAGHADSVAGHFALGQALEELGDLEGAREAYGWFDVGGMRFMDKWRGRRGGEQDFPDAEQLVLIGRAIDRLATLNGFYNENRKLHDEILGMFVRAYDVIDREYWPAHVAAAEYFLSHDQQDEAMEELNAALAGNPNDARSWELRGEIALEVFNFDKADGVIAALRKVNPRSAMADLLEARSLLRQRKPREAEASIQRVMAEQPGNLTAMGLLAAAQSLQLKDQRAAETLSAVEAIDPDNATAYFEVAEQLGAMRQYPRAAAMYQIAIDRAPWWTPPRNGQGLLYTQSGDEERALAVLDAAHVLDPFNLKTTNYLKLLDMLGKFARKESAHFVVMYDAQLDPVIPEYFSDYLESIYADVCKQFQHEPGLKTYIEVFPTHEAFSVRTTGSPWIGTVGASTGRVIALVAPRQARVTMGPFNWSQVLKHEFTHTVTLSATENRISHWMTEGLAVQEENSPLRWEWVPMLYNAVKKHQLFTMDGLTWGFIRPKRPMDRQLAYAQSSWICQYIAQKYGHEAILKMMESFKAGKAQEDVFPEVLGNSIREFQLEFFDWAEQQVRSWGYDEQTTKKYEELRAKGEGMIKSRQYAEAAAVWEEIARLRPVDPLPHQRLAGLYLNKAVNEPEKATEHLIALHKVELKDNRYAKRIARVYRDAEKLEVAVHYAREAVYIDPYDVDAHELLAALCEKAGDTTASAHEKKVIEILSRWQREEEHRRGGAATQEAVQ